MAASKIIIKDEVSFTGNQQSASFSLTDKKNGPQIIFNGSSNFVGGAAPNSVKGPTSNLGLASGSKFTMTDNMLQSNINLTYSAASSPDGKGVGTGAVGSISEWTNLKSNSVQN